MGKPNEPIWFNENKATTLNADTYQTIKTNKVDSGQQTLEKLNPETKVEVIPYQLEGDELKQTIESVDMVLDCSDNYPTRFEVNRYCVETGTILVTGAAIRFEGQIMNYQHQLLYLSPCLVTLLLSLEYS